MKIVDCADKDRIVSPDREGIFLSVSHSDYCADPAPLPSVSSSLVSKILDLSPMHARSEHPRFAERRDDDEDDSSEAMDRGSILDCLIFGNGPEIVKIDADSFRTNVAKVARDDARARGAIPVIASKHGMYVAVAEAMKSRLSDAGIDLSEGYSQVTMLWKIGDVWCRGRLDHWFPEQGVVLDLKTTISAAPRSVRKKMSENGYDVQHAAYVGPLGGLTTLVGGDPQSMRFIFIEAKQPFGLLDVEPDGELAALGARRWKRAIEIWGECQRTGLYPGYPRGPQKVSAEEWRIAADMEDQLGRMETPGSQPF